MNDEHMNSNEQGSRIDLKTLLAQREFNHLRLLKLMPNLESNDRFHFCYHPVSGYPLQLSLEVTHRSLHTLTIKMCQQADQKKLSIPWLQDILSILWLQDIRVQLYLDAKAVEVIECNERPLSTKHACCGYEGYIQHLLKKARYDSLLANLLTFWINHAMAPISTLPDAVNQTNPQPLANAQHPVRKTDQGARRPGN